MRKELENQLAEKFPFMKRGKNMSEQRAEGYIGDLYGAFGCECGDGWYSLLHDLCEEITAVYEKAGVPIDIKPAQIKEKYGGLRYYFDFVGSEQAIHAMDYAGKGIRYKVESSELHEQINEIVSRYEEKSETVCEDCGKDGKLRNDIGWIRTLCDTCHEKEKERNSPLFR